MRRRLHLAGPGAGREARDEVIQLRDLLFALRVLAFDLRADLRLGHHHLVVAAGIGDDGFVIDVGDVGADAVQEMAVVRDDDHHAVILLQKALQPVDRVQIKMVRGLVQQQRLRMSEQRLRQQHADLLPALQLAHRTLMQFVWNVEALQQQRRVGLGGVAILFADDAFQFAQPHAVFVRDLVLLVDGRALPSPSQRRLLPMITVSSTR